MKVFLVTVAALACAAATPALAQSSMGQGTHDPAPSHGQPMQMPHDQHNQGGGMQGGGMQGGSMPNGGMEHGGMQGAPGRGGHDGMADRDDHGQMRGDDHRGMGKGNQHASARSRHVRACEQRYHSYNPRTDRYTVRHGQTRRCML